MKRRLIIPLLPLALLAACASFGKKESDAERLAQVMDYAGAPIERFTYLGRYDSWQPIGNDRVLIHTAGSNAYLITVAPTCFDLKFANRIGLTNTASTVSSRFDSVRVDGQRCMITEIRPIDYRQMKEDARRAG